MKNKMFKRLSIIFASLIIFTFVLAGCDNLDNTNTANNPANSGVSNSNNTDNSKADTSTNTATNELEVRFGDSEMFIMHLYNNDTSAAIVRYVGTSDWTLPIYHFDDVMQYYDIPSRCKCQSKIQKNINLKVQDFGNAV